MNQYKQEFKKNKEEIIKLLEKSMKFCSNIEKQQVAEIFDKAIIDLENEEFSIVIVGEFSAGKSTFLNALMGENMLPSFSAETTATINFLRHIEKSPHGEAGIVYYNDGTTEPIPDCSKKTITKYVSTKGDHVATRVDHLDVYLDSKFLMDNVTLVDSPGLNGIAEGHADITENQIRKSSACIYLFRANQPGSASDFQFLSNLKSNFRNENGNNNNIFFVLNMIDRINDKEETIDDVINNLKQNYKKQFPEETTIPEILPVSAIQALTARSSTPTGYHDRDDYTQEEKEILLKKSHMEQFEDRLWKFLTQGDKTKLLLYSPVSKIQNELSRIREELQNNLKTLENSTDSQEIKEHMQVIQEKIDNMQLEMKNLSQDVHFQLGTLENDIQNSIDSKIEKLREREVKRYDSFADINELEDFENTIDNELSRSLKKIANDIENEYQTRIDEVISLNYRNIASTLNQNLSNTNFSININTKYEPTETSYNHTIEEADKQINDLELKINNLIEQIDSTEISRLKANRIRKEKEKLEQELKDKKNAKENYLIKNEEYKPKMQYKNEEYKEQVHRGGLFGGIAFLLNGKKYETKIRQIADDTEIKDWERIRDESTKKYDDRIKSIQNDLNKLNYHEDSKLDVDELTSTTKKLNRQLERFEKEMEEARIQRTKQFQKENNRILRQKKNQLSNYFYDVSDEVRNELSKNLKAEKNSLVDCIITSISSELNLKLETKKNELNNLTIQLESSQEEKQKHIDEINKQIDSIEDIISEAVELSVKIDSIETDVIKNVAL